MIPELTLIVPFRVPAAEVVDDVHRQLTSPGLERLLAHAREVEREHHDDAYLSTLSHECWLAKHTGLPISPLSSAPHMRLADGDTADTRTWACLQPAHIHAARDHLAMPNPAQSRLEVAGVDTLHAAIAPLVDEMGITLDAMYAARWYVADSSSGDFIVTAPQCATSHNTDIWMHKGEQERIWRKLQNEIQMTWYNHSVNQAREACGLLPVNSVWLLGRDALVDTRPIVKRMIGADPFSASLCHVGHVTEFCAKTLAAVSFDNISAAALLGDAGKSYFSADWYDWVETLRAYNRDWFPPAADALVDGHVDVVSFVLTGDSHYVHHRVTRHELVIGPFGWLHRSSRPRTLRDALSPLSMAA